MSDLQQICLTQNTYFIICKNRLATILPPKWKHLFDSIAYQFAGIDWQQKSIVQAQGKNKIERMNIPDSSF